MIEPKHDPVYLPLPLFGCRVPAGFPSPADDHLEESIDLNRLLVKSPASTFFIRVSGHSMRGAGIYDGDLAVVDRSLKPRLGCVVVAIVDGELTLKRMVRGAHGVALKSEHPDYPLLEFSEGNEFAVWGVATFVIHSLK